MLWYLPLIFWHAFPLILSTQSESTAAEDPSAVRALVWATTVDPNESMVKFKDFLLNFTVAHRLKIDRGEEFDAEALTDDDKRPYYPRVFQQVCVRECVPVCVCHTE